jgi:hypothetical protein
MLPPVPLKLLGRAQQTLVQVDAAPFQTERLTFAQSECQG